MKNKKTKAFTLVELLIVVLVLGILAGVAVPKFKRVLETRKTTEAENMLAAVRTEQEKLCIMGKQYQTDASKVEMLANASKSANYDYSLTSSGMRAIAKKGSYSLEMLSYKEGNIFCKGDGCDSINKNYPNCKDHDCSIKRDECSMDVECGPAQLVNSGGKDEGFECKQTRSGTCDSDTGEMSYSSWGAWSGSGTSSGTISSNGGDCTTSWTKSCDSSGNVQKSTGSTTCTCAHVTASTQETKGKCKRTVASKTCNSNNEWEYTWNSWSGSDSGTETSGRCSTPWTANCDSNGDLGNKSYGTTTCTCEGQSGNSTTQTRTVNISNGSCSESRTCNTSTGEWSNWISEAGDCSCNSGYTWNSSTKTCEQAEEDDCYTNPNQEKCCTGPSVWVNGTCKSPETVCCMVTTQYGNQVRLTQTQSWNEQKGKFEYSTGPCCHQMGSAPPAGSGVVGNVYFGCNNDCDNPSCATGYDIKWKLVAGATGNRHGTRTSYGCTYDQDYFNSPNRLSSRPTAGASCSPGDKGWIYLLDDANCGIEDWYCTKTCRD